MPPIRTLEISNQQELETLKTILNDRISFLKDTMLDAVPTSPHAMARLRQLTDEQVANHFSENVIPQIHDDINNIIALTALLRQLE